MRDRRSPYDELARALIRSERVPTRMTGSTTAGGNDEENQADAWTNPMSAIGDLITGTEGGAATKLAIGAAGQVLVVTLVGSNLVPRWGDASAAAGQYRQYVLVPDGANGFAFVDDGAGNPVTTLETLE